MDRSTVEHLVDSRHWRVLRHALHATFRTGSFVTGLTFVQRVAAAAEAAGHHPDVDLRYATVHVALTSHDAGTLTARDTALAAEVSAIADELGLAGEPGTELLVEVAIDAMDIPAVRPFWRAVLGYPGDGDDPADDVLDPAGRAPGLWFQQMDAPRPQRNRIHLDVHVPADAAPDRVAAALAAGGRLVNDGFAPSFWVLADAEGNEACVCTWQDHAADAAAPTARPAPGA